MLKNLGQTIDQLKPYLKQYLKQHNTKFTSKFFQCPNRIVHRRLDQKPSANFYPDENHWLCFVCRARGSIIEACHYLEGKPITGSALHETVKYLCQKFNVPFQEIVDTSAENQFLQEVQQFLLTLVKKGNQTLKELIQTVSKEPIVQLLKTKQWLDSVDKFQLGTILKTKTPSGRIKEICDYLNLDLNDLKGNLIIPLFDAKGLFGIQIRRIEGEPKYKTYLASIKKKLFNLDRIDPSKPVYLVEGASSVLTLNSKQVNNVVATLGNHFTESDYEALVRRKVRQIVVVFDNDSGGDQGRRAVCDVCSPKLDIEVIFALLEEYNDPGDYVIAGKKLQDLKVLSLWDYLKLTSQKRNLFIYLATQDDLVKKEKLVADLTKYLHATKQTILDEAKKYEKTPVSTIEALQEKESLIETINIYEKWAWSRGQLLGLSSYKCFDTYLDGLQNGMILVSSPPNQGKSALCISLALEILKKNRDVYIVYLTIDDSILITLSRFLANISGLPINTVANPKFKIMQNPTLTDEQKKSYMMKREEALEYLRDKVSLFNLKDATHGYTIEYLQRLLETTKSLFRDKSLVIVVDNLHKLRSERYARSDKIMVDLVSNNLKLLSSLYQCPLIATAEVTKQSIQMGDTSAAAMKETVSLQYDANLILTIVTKQVIHNRLKLVDVVVNKNKLSTFIGKLPFRFSPELSKMEEEDLTEESIQ